MDAYAPILVVIGLAVVITATMLILAHAIGPQRHGRVKDDTYESGVPVIGDARRRFNVRFYLVAMLFLLFDVEVVFLWPWAPLFYNSAVRGQTLSFGGWSMGKGFLLSEMVVFLLILLVGYVYAWRKGVFRWD
ncbi:MAG TPA: NADH-quinone oxidoreductase subunit A [Phycisphaerae bacterium]|jgi:NADH-quinone oxidoreductase subunit A